MRNNDTTVDLETGVSLQTIISTPDDSHLSNKPALLLLHFWGGSNRTFSRLTAELQSKHNLIAPSLRGWGESSKSHQIRTYNISDYARDIVQLVEQLQASHPVLLSNGIIILGHSMGGKIAQVLTDYPELEQVIKGLVLVAPAPARKFSLPFDMREQQIHAYDNIESATFVVKNVLLRKPDAVPEEEIAALATNAAAGSQLAKEFWPKHGMGEDFFQDLEHAVWDWKSYGRGNLKVLIVTGALDRVETPENVHERVVMSLGHCGAI